MKEGVDSICVVNVARWRCVLDLQLKELVEDGLVAKTIYPELPPRSEYSITALGMTLIPIIDAMIDWGNQNAALFEKKYGPKTANLNEA